MVDIIDLMNQGLRAGGVPKRIQDYYDGSDAAQVALELFGQARDELQRLTDWSFNRGVGVLTLLKGPPPAGGYSSSQPWSSIYPDPNWLFEYVYPSDCLDVRSIYPQPVAVPDLDPVPQVWRVENDLTPVVSGSPPAAGGPPAKVILCNVNQAMITYRRQVTDPDLWDTGYIAALVESLGKKFAEAFGADPNEVRQQHEEAVLQREMSADVRG